MEQFRDKINKITVDFERCGASSLDIWFSLDCKGSLASHYLWAKRKIQLTFVEICNEEKLVIPFAQVTISSRPDTNINQQQ